MNPTTIACQTRAIGAPANWNPVRDGQCGVLSVRDDIADVSGYPTMTSAWLPTKDERERIQNGLPILLTIYGRTHPVVSMTAGWQEDVPPTT